MKRLFTLLFITTTLMFSLAACGNGGASQGNNTVPGSQASQPTQPAESAFPEKADETKETPTPQESAPVAEVTEQEAEPETVKILVAYFSWSGNTRSVANIIQGQTGADIFEISTVNDYSTDYNTVLDEAKAEQNANARPELKASIDNMDEYDTVFIGYPNWWGDMPMSLYSFLDEYDLSDKTVIPFCTHGGSGFSGTVRSIGNAEPDATVLDGLAIRDSNVAGADGDITDWLNSLGIIE